MYKQLCLVALCALWNGYCIAAQGKGDAVDYSDIYIDGESKGYDAYEGSALYDEASGVNGYDVDSQYDDSDEGSATGGYKLSDCEESLQRVQKQKLVGAYEPRCTEDGQFEAMQCKGSTGQCWCVNYEGAIIPGTKDITPWSPKCDTVDRSRTYPKFPTVIEKGDNVNTGTGPNSNEDSDEIVEGESDGKMEKNPDSGVDIGPVDTDGDTDPEGGESYESGPEKIERKGMLGQPLILAGLIAIAVVCLLCAVLLVMFIVYRMRKKDEGSYALDEPKRSPSHPYQRAPTREYFA